MEALLCDLFDISAHDIERRIKTVLLNGQPVDDLVSTVVEDGSVLALSAAMPGLAGAILRRGGHLAVLRHSITHEPNKEKRYPRTGTITVKLFNVLFKELGLPLLANGILLDGSTLKTILKNMAEDLPEICSEMTLDNDRGGVSELLTDDVLQNMRKGQIWMFKVASMPVQ